MVLQEGTRRRLRAGGLILLVAGLLSLGFGVAAPHLAPDRVPLRVLPGRPAPLFGAGPFGGAVGLYAGGTATGSGPASLEEFGCTTGDGAGALTRAGLARFGERVVDDVALVPVGRVVKPSSGRAITCTGPAATGASALYLILEPGQRDLAPMAAFSVAAFGIVLGLAATIALRPLRDE